MGERGPKRWSGVYLKNCVCQTIEIACENEVRWSTDFVLLCAKSCRQLGELMDGDSTAALIQRCSRKLRPRALQGATTYQLHQKWALPESWFAFMLCR